MTSNSQSWFFLFGFQVNQWLTWLEEAESEDEDEEDEE